MILLTAVVTANASTIVTAQLFASSPTDPIAAGAMTPVGEFQFLNGNDVNVLMSSLRFQLTETGSMDPWTSAMDVTADVSTVQLFDDTGLQLGPTMTPSSCGGAHFSMTSFDCSFSPLSFVFPRMSVRVLTVALTLQSGTDLTSIRASLLPSFTANGSFDDGEERLFAPAIRVDGNLLRINLAETDIPESSNGWMCGIGLCFIGLRFLQLPHRLRCKT